MQNKDKIINAYFQARKYLPRDTLNSRLRLNERRVHQWTAEKTCEKSIIKKCFLTYTGQLTISEQEQFKRYLHNPEYSNLPRNHIWAKARREGLMMGLRSFYKYAHALDGYREVKQKRREFPVTTIRADKPLAILHMDSTLISCLNGERVYIHFIMDNYSRKILGAVPTYSSKSEVVAMNLKQVIIKNRLYDKYIKLYCDDGPENQVYVKDLIRTDRRIRIDRIVATYNFQKNNNMIEYWNHKLKYIVLKRYKPESFKHLQSILPEMINYSNNLHLPVLNTLSPNEAIKGKKKKDVYNDLQTILARHRRKIENNKLICEELCPHVQAIYSKRKKEKKLYDLAGKRLIRRD
jgi:putative transposase